MRTGPQDRAFISRVVCLAVLLTVASGCSTGGTDRIAGSAALSLETPDQVPLGARTAIAVVNAWGTFTIEPFARYRIAARVGSERFYNDGWRSSLSPIDLVLVWGPLSDPGVFEKIPFSQAGRWYYFKKDLEFPFSDSFIIEHSSNNHIVPSTRRVERTVKSVKTNDLVLLEGFLVAIRGGDGAGSRSWKSSASRTDRMDGACEIIYVERMEILTGR